MNLGGSASEVWSLRYRFLRGKKMSKEESAQAYKLLNSEQKQYEKQMVYMNHMRKKNNIEKVAPLDLENTIRQNIKKNKKNKEKHGNDRNGNIQV